MSSPLTPLADRVVAVKEAAQTKTASGLFLPDNAKEKSQVAVVDAVGPDVKTLKKATGSCTKSIALLSSKSPVLNT